jgi:hypothetical protein
LTGDFGNAGDLENLVSESFGRSVRPLWRPKLQVTIEIPMQSCRSTIKWTNAAAVGIECLATTR